MEREEVGMTPLFKDYISCLEEYQLIAEVVLEREGWGEADEKERLMELGTRIANHIGKFGGIKQRGTWREN